MMYQQLQKVFNNYPKIKQLAYKLLASVPYSILLGKGFWKWYAFFEESESWNLEQLHEFQINQIRILLSELVRTSTFYRSRFGDLDISSITSLDDFSAKIPTLSKDDVRNNYSEILNCSWQTQKLAKSQTSGTTGLALQFYHATNDSDREWAAICHQWKRVGYLPGESKRAEFRGLTSPNKLVELFPHKRMIRCSILNLKREYIKHFADEIRKDKIDFYHGYPSALYLLAKEINNNGPVFPQPKAILLASEMVYDWQIDQIQSAFPKAGIFAHYGCAERTVLAGWCEYRREYHVLPQYALVEVDEKTSEIVGTNLYNSINGFVRYRMTDTVLGMEKIPCPDCHRPYTPRFVELGGRFADYLFSRENGWIPPAIVTYPFKTLKAIREVQLYQKEKTEIVVQYTLLPRIINDLIERELEELESGLHRLFGKSMRLKFKVVDDFQKDQSGKFKWIVCKLEEMPSR